MKTNSPVVGIDVGSTHSWFAVLDCEQKMMGKPFKESNDSKGLTSVLARLGTIEKTLGNRPTILLESTGHYSSRLLQFFIGHGYSTYLINPLQSHSINVAGIRKAKTDKIDCVGIASLFFILDLHEFVQNKPEIDQLKIISRDLAYLCKQRTAFINRLLALLEQIWPGFTKAFPDAASKTALAVLSRWSSPTALLEASAEDVHHVISSSARRSAKLAQCKYDKLKDSAQDALYCAIDAQIYQTSLLMLVESICFMDAQICTCNKQIDSIARNIPEIAVLESIPGVGRATAVTIMAETGGISRFKTAKSLAAFCGIDPSVRQSGNFTGTKNHFTKRGSAFLRRAFYLAAAVAIRASANGTCVNPVLRDFYLKKCCAKPKKVVLGAVMHKLVKIVFAVLKSGNPFVLVTPEEHVLIHNAQYAAA